MTEVWSAEKTLFLASTGHSLALGGPGAGKTHAALVKARNEVRQGVLKPGQKVLFLSFARPTVARIIEKAAELVSRDELQHLEISTYHGFAWNILRSHGYLLNGKAALELLPPPEAAAHLTDIPRDNRDQEKLRLFQDEGKLHFDIFARLVGELLGKSARLAGIYADTYPIVILDEFQDTNGDEWSMIQQFGRGSRLIALADPEQRIYEFRGADPRRLQEFIDAFRAETFDFTGENHRSGGTDITTFGNDLLTGANKRKQYQQVKVIEYGYYFGKGAHFRVKVTALQALARLKDVPDKSLAILVPSKRLMLEVSDYFSSDSDHLPSLNHDVAMDTEPPALAAAVIAALVEGGTASEVASRVIAALHSHIRGRRGGRVTPKGDLQVAGALTTFLNTGRVSGSKRTLIVNEVQRIAAERVQLVMTGDSGEDWLRLRALLENSAAEALQQVARDGEYLRLLHRGSALRTSLGELWRVQGHYAGAAEAVRNALVQEHFSMAQKEWRGIHLMTIHKSKGKEFDEVVLYEGRYLRYIRNPADARAAAQDMLAMRVGVTRAMRRATILTPAKDSCAFLA
jgi:DNA helicase II / ATP-dependent DNA helicase PcrA